MSPSLSCRPYTRDQLPGLCQFMSHRAQARLPAPTKMMTSDLAWQFPGCDPKSNINMWYESETLVGFGWFQPPCGFVFDMAEPMRDSLTTQIIQWASERRSAFEAATMPFLETKDMTEWAAILNHEVSPTPVTEKVLITSVFEDDSTSIALLLANGFESTQHTEMHLLHDLSDLPGKDSAIQTRAIEPGEMDAFAAAHRDAWHPGSSLNRDRLIAISRVADIFDPQLCLVAISSNEFAGTGIFWSDPVSQVGNIEPFGVRSAFRGKGVSRALIFEGLRRLKAKGMQHARVYTAGFNHQAQRLYLSCGFKISGTSRTYQKIC